MRRCRAAVVCVSLAAVLLVARGATAFERQWHAGANAGYAALLLPTGAALHGFGGGLHLTYGLSDTLNLLVMADASVHPAVTYKAKPVDGALLAGGAVGVGYVVDILQWVPYVGAAAGCYYEVSPKNSGPRLGLQIPFGLDYQLSRRFALGVAGDYRLLFLDPTGVTQRIAVYLRGEYIWGY